MRIGIEIWDSSLRVKDTNETNASPRVAEFEAQELSKSGAMIHPEYIQLRPDIKPIEIQLENYLF